MPITSHDIRQSLLANDVEFRHLAEEHSRCESQLEQLIEQPYMSSEDLTLETTLKKMKLRLKDQMELIVQRHQHSALRR
ncbi:MAG: YdcH family protein [Candidatus Acidiferrales bacterium]